MDMVLSCWHVPDAMASMCKKIPHQHVEHHMHAFVSTDIAYGYRMIRWLILHRSVQA